MSRILVDLPDSQVEELAVLVEAEQRPRAALCAQLSRAPLLVRRKPAFSREGLPR